MLAADFPEVTRLRLEVIASDVVDGVVPEDDLVSIAVVNVAELEFVAIPFTIVSTFEFALEFTIKVDVGLVDFVIFIFVVVVIVDIVVLLWIVIVISLSANFPEVTGLIVEDIASELLDGVVPEDEFVTFAVANLAELEFAPIAFTLVSIFVFVIGLRGDAVEFTSFVDGVTSEIAINE